MRATRPPLALMGSLALCIGLATIATAQEEPAPVTFVTGSVAEVYTFDVADEDESDLDESDLDWNELRGYAVVTQSGGPLHQVVEWSDPRLPTDLWLTLGYTLISRGEAWGELDDGAMNTASRSLLEDEEGRWRGTGRLVQGADHKYSLYVLTGEGAYEGLSALLRGMAPTDVEASLLHAHGPWDMAYEGYIFETELTPFPDEPVPLTNGAYQLWPTPSE